LLMPKVVGANEKYRLSPGLFPPRLLLWGGEGGHTILFAPPKLWRHKKSTVTLTLSLMKSQNEHLGTLSPYFSYVGKLPGERDRHRSMAGRRVATGNDVGPPGVFDNLRGGPNPGTGRNDVLGFKSCKFFGNPNLISDKVIWNHFESLAHNELRQDPSPWAPSKGGGAAPLWGHPSSRRNPHDYHTLSLPVTPTKTPGHPTPHPARGLAP